AGSFRDGTRVASSSPNLVRAMTEGNAAALRTALDEAVHALTAAREELDEGSTKTLVDAGNAARLQYEQHQRFEITDITPGEPGWREKLQDAGRRGGVVRQIRSASPG
ncbi:MAG: prephenate dehydrogenase dimerization domain-containing protein, partial [Rhodococcus sp. (in: high G+C Gram-positive bacteria)]